MAAADVFRGLERAKSLENLQYKQKTTTITTPRVGGLFIFLFLGLIIISYSSSATSGTSIDMYVSIGLRLTVPSGSVRRW